MSAVFHKAVLDGDATVVKFIVKNGQGIRVNQPNKYGLTALQQACLDGNIALVNFLLECGAELSYVDAEGRTALHFASEQGHADVVSLLVNSACADVNARNALGERAVDVAKNEQVRALLSQAMLSENFKQKCSVASRWDENGYCCGFKNVPGCRYSISSTSTDSGVSEDSVHSHDSGLMESRIPSRYYKAAAQSSYGFYGSEQNGHFVPESATSSYLRDPKQEPEDVIRARRIEPIHAAVAKSHSFTGNRHEHSARLENVAEERHQRDVEYGFYSQPPRYRRQQKVRKDPARRKTVTFGEVESYSNLTRDEACHGFKSYSLTRPMISSSNRQPLPETWGDLYSPSADEQSPSMRRYSQPRDPIRKENDKRMPKAKEESPKKEAKLKRNMLPGFLEKYVR